MADPIDSLLVRTGRGDAVAFAEVYAVLAARVHGLVLRVVRDQNQSEEVTQEVFLQVWQTAAGFDPARGSGRSWVLTRARRRAVDRVRSSQAARRRDDTESRLVRDEPQDDTVLAAHADLEAQSVREALAILPTAQRVAVELAYWGGHTHAEVSRLLQIPLGTAKSRIRDGLVKLRPGLSSLSEEVD